jgi:hypothetical protein
MDLGMTGDLLSLGERCEKATFRSFGSYYTVSDSGEIWSAATGKLVRLSPTLSQKGYARLTLIIDGARKDVRVNRVVCEAWHGPPPFPDAVARHLDDDRSNNAAVNLAWGTASDNARDALRNGRTNPAANGRSGAVKISGENGPMAKLTWEIVKQIRRRASDGQNNSEIARAMNIGRSNVSLIVSGRTWKESANV